MNKKYIPGLIGFILLVVLFCLYAPAAFPQDRAANGYHLKTVVIDPGHGGKDPGSVGRKTSEKHVVLAIAKKLGAYIEKQIPDVRVVYTRTTDEFIPLHRRAEIANMNKADLFISIHANGNTNASASGTETLVLGLHRADENFEVAKKENGVILLEEDYSTKYEGFDPNSRDSYLIFTLMQNLYFDKSITFAALVQDQFRERAKRKDRGLNQQGLLVLAQTAMPGVLIETGFITNRDEEDYLMSDQGQDYIASAVFRAFRDYKNLMESRSSSASLLATDIPGSGQAPSSTVAGIGGGPDSLAQNEETSKDAISSSSAKGSVEFKVQVAVSRKQLPDASGLFGGLGPVSEFRVEGLYKYAVGGSSNFEEIVAFSRQVKAQIPDAFIVGVRDGMLIPLEQALRDNNNTRSNQ